MEKGSQCERKGVGPRDPKKRGAESETENERGGAGRSSKIRLALRNGILGIDVSPNS